MTEPLHLSFEVECSAEHAFEVWTAATGLWWPPDHTMSGDPETVEIESKVGHGTVVRVTIPVKPGGRATRLRDTQ